MKQSTSRNGCATHEVKHDELNAARWLQLHFIRRFNNSNVHGRDARYIRTFGRKLPIRESPLRAEQG